MNYEENSSCWKRDTAENSLCSACNMAFTFDRLHTNLHHLHLQEKTRSFNKIPPTSRNTEENVLWSPNKMPFVVSQLQLLNKA
jgi:hypothetical protein